MVPATRAISWASRLASPSRPTPARPFTPLWSWLGIALCIHRSSRSHVNAPHTGADVAKDVVGDGAGHARDLLGIQAGVAFAADSCAAFHALVVLARDSALYPPVVTITRKRAAHGR